MKLWDNIRNYFYRKNLNAKLAQSAAKRNIVNLHDAKSIGILYNSTEAGSDNVITQLAVNLEGQGKEVDMLSYKHDSAAINETGHAVFNKKDVSWSRVPSGSKVEQFATKQFDLLLACFPAENFPLEYISYISNAKCRIGVYSPDKTGCYDLMINIGDRKELPYLVEQTIHFLNQIKYDSN